MTSDFKRAEVSEETMENVETTEEQDFKAFLPYMGMAATLFMVWNHLNKLSVPFRQKAHVKSGENCSSGF